MALQMQQSDIAGWEQSFLEDKFKDLRGPISVDRVWMNELHRIDDRLVLRWQPIWGMYAVFMKVSTGRLFGQPVHLIKTDEGRARRPDNRDLDLIRRAHYLAIRSGARDKIARLDRMLADNERAESENRERVLQEQCRQVARKHDLTYSDLGRTRKAVRSHGRR